MNRTLKVLKFIGVNCIKRDRYEAPVSDDIRQICFTPLRKGVKCRFLNQPMNSFSAVEVDSVRGARKNLQQQIDDISSELAKQADTTLTSKLEILSDTYIRLTREHKQLASKLDAAIKTVSILSNALAGVDNLPFSIPRYLEKLDQDKLDAHGDITLVDNVVKMSKEPTSPEDLTNKAYVDAARFGINWIKEVQAATTLNISLNGLFEVDSRMLNISDRVLVKDQHERSQNGIYFAANGAWTKISSQTHDKPNTGVFVEFGKVNGGTSWVKSSDGDFNKISSPLTFGFSDGVKFDNSKLSIDAGPGIAVDGYDGVHASLHANGGLMYTVDNNTPITKISANRKKAKIALTKTGVTKGTYNSDAGSMSSITVDDAGRIIKIGAAAPLTPNFESIKNLPSSLSEYGIKDAVNISGATMSGTLSFSSGARIFNGQDKPSMNTSSFCTSRYGDGGDQRTHFGYNEVGTFVNYIRGSRSEFEGDIHLTCPSLPPIAISNIGSALSIKSGDTTLIHLDNKSGGFFKPATHTTGLSLAAIKDIFADGIIDYQKILKYSPESIREINGVIFIEASFVLRCLPSLIQSL